MDRTRKKRTFAFLMIGTLSFVVGSCGLADDSKDKALDPVAEGTGNIALTTASEVALGVMDILASTTGSFAKPASGNLTALTTLRDKECGNGGTMIYSENQSAGTFDATFLECGDENVVIEGSATGTIGSEVVCGVEVLPTAMTGTFDGTVTVEGEDFNFDGFTVAATNIMYGPDCDLDGGSFDAVLTGAINGEVAGESFGIDFGTGSLNIDVTSIIDTNGVQGDGFGRQATMNINGTITIDSPCEKGSLTISATDIMTAQPNVCPFSGSADYSGAHGNASVVFDGSCDFIACEFNADNLNPF